MKNLIQPKLAQFLLGGYFLALVAYCFIKVPFRDTFYYWEWSRHLALSYYDGPPMIAYIIRLFTSIFGSSIFVLNLASLICLSFTGYFVYKIGELSQDKTTGLIACLLWALFPLTSSELLAKFTYDTPLNLFWALSLYCIVRYIKYQKTSDLYWIGIALGLMMLSKYSGIVLVIGILLFLLLSQYRKLFTNIHFYLSILLALLIFSPVLIWNMYHNWVSFQYLSDVHKLTNPHPSHYIGNFLGNYCIFFLLPLVAWFNHKSEAKSELMYLMALVSGVFFLFWLWAALSSVVFMNYLTPATIGLSVLCAYYLQKCQYQKTFRVIIAIFFIASLWKVIVGYDQNDPAAYSVAQSAIQSYNKDGAQPILTADFATAEQISFWAPHIMVHPLPCAGQENQYQYWDHNFVKTLEAKQIKQALFMAFVTRNSGDVTTPPSCISQYFASCKLLPVLVKTNVTPITHKVLIKQIYVYQCTN